MCENDFKDVVDSEFNTSYIECDAVATVFSYLLQCRHHRQRVTRKQDQRMTRMANLRYKKTSQGCAA